MKRVLMLLILLVGILHATEQVVVYNDNLALIKDEITLENVKKGKGYYTYDDITSQIKPESVVLIPKSADISVLEQNFEYDLGNTETILQKYMGKEINIETVNGNKFDGELQFNDTRTIGLKSADGSISLISIKDIQNIQLVKMPENFYLKPTLRWEIDSKKKLNLNADLSYLTGGLNWEAIYNMVWNDENLTFHSWINMDNHSGKSFDNIKLKLIAGNINRIRSKFKRKRRSYDLSVAGIASAPTTQQAFHDFHMYTVSHPVSINDKQTKQIRLYDTKIAKADRLYKYNTFNDEVEGYIKFRNNEESGMGIPLPAGKVMVYRADQTDNEMALIGESLLNHTSKKEVVEIKTGTAFDIKGETVVVEQRNHGKGKYTRKIEITLKNRSDKKARIRVIHRFDNGTKLIKSTPKLKVEKAGKAACYVDIDADSVIKISITEKKD